ERRAPQLAGRYEDGAMGWTPTPLIGRADELATLLTTVDAAAAGRAGAVLLAGDAGVGKSRLLAEVAERARERSFAVVVGQCSDFGDTGLPFLPFTEIFGRLAGEEPALVDELVSRRFPPVAKLLPIQRLIGAPEPSGDGRVERAVLFDAVVGMLGAITEQRPHVLILEDVHWADESTRELLGFLLARLTGQRLTVLVSYRSDDLHRRHP